MPSKEYKTQKYLIRSLVDARDGEIVRRPTFLLLNANVIEDGERKGIITLDFQGSELPSSEDLEFVIGVEGNFVENPKHGQQFSVCGWAIIEGTELQTPVVRHAEVKRISEDHFADLTRPADKKASTLTLSGDVPIKHKRPKD